MQEVCALLQSCLSAQLPAQLCCSLHLDQIIGMVQGSRLCLPEHIPVLRGEDTGHFMGPFISAQVHAMIAVRPFRACTPQQSVLYVSMLTEW